MVFILLKEIFKYFFLIKISISKIKNLLIKDLQPNRDEDNSQPDHDEDNFQSDHDEDNSQPNRDKDNSQPNRDEDS